MALPAQGCSWGAGAGRNWGAALHTQRAGGIHLAWPHEPRAGKRQSGPGWGQLVLPGPQHERTWEEVGWGSARHTVDGVMSDAGWGASGPSTLHLSPLEESPPQLCGELCCSDALGEERRVCPPSSEPAGLSASPVTHRNLIALVPLLGL